MDPYRAPVDELPLREYYPQERTRRRISRARPRPAAPAGEGDLVLERYRLIERLGAGGFGVVWRARDEVLDREVAVKRIPLVADDDGERAGREAMACARLCHPAIVALYEACTVGDAFYLISELVDGDTLARHIAEGSLDDEEALEIALALTGALEHAHERGVIHRDIKPHNVLVPASARQGRVAAKLADFGGASLVGEDALTRTGDVLGTLAYMAPEQTEGREVGEEADLYSLALVLYEALAGLNPVRGPSPAATARAIGRPVAPLSSSRGDLPDFLCSAVDQALEPDPAERGELADLRAAVQQALELPARPGPRRRSARPQPLPGRSPREPLRPATEVMPAPGAEDTAIAQTAGRRLSLPRSAWLICGALLIAWQLAQGRPGLGLLVLAALAPVLLLPRESGSTRVGAGWVCCALAPALGAVGLAAAFPAIAGQSSRWVDRAARGALGFWWLVLAEPLLGRRLWLGSPPPAGSRAAWESSLSATASHVLSPVLTVGVLLGAALWALGSVLLPWLVRGRSAVLDLFTAAAWSAVIAVATIRLSEQLSGQAAPTSPRGLALGAVLGGMLAVAARALRGPV